MSPQKVTTIGLCALLTSAATPILAASAAERPGYLERSGAADARAGAEALRQKRELEAVRQSLAAEARARAAEERARAMQRRTDEILKGAPTR